MHCVLKCFIRSKEIGGYILFFNLPFTKGNDFGFTHPPAVNGICQKCFAFSVMSVYMVGITSGIAVLLTCTIVRADRLLLCSSV